MFLTLIKSLVFTIPRRMTPQSQESFQMQKIYFVRAEWDDQARVWVATSDDVPGLVTEADTMELLFSKLEIMVPELLAANGYPDKDEISYEVLARRFSVTLAASIS